MEAPGNNFTPKNAGFICEACDFKCGKPCDWNRHVNTIKHHNALKNKYLGEKSVTPKNADLICYCGKGYNSNSGLWKHKRKCNSVKKSDLPIVNNNDITFLTNLVLEVVKNNSELQRQNKELQIKMLALV
jgi:hypothetical protein